MSPGRFWKRGGEEPEEEARPDADPELTEAFGRAHEAAQGGPDLTREERRRLDRASRHASNEEIAAAAAAVPGFGAAPVADARMAAIERLTELRAAGRISDEDFAREKKRLENYG